MGLLRRFDTIQRVAPDLDLQPGAQYTITAYRPGAVVSAQGTLAQGQPIATTFGVYAGHGLRVNDKIMVGIDPAAYYVVSVVNGNQITAYGRISVVVGDTVINLDQDSGATAPNYDGSQLTIYSTPYKTNSISQSAVVTNGDGEFSYYHSGESNIWELIRDGSGAPVDFTIDAYQFVDAAVQNEVRYAHQFATSGSGTASDPWVGWERGVIDGAHSHFVQGTYSTANLAVGVTLSNKASQTSITGDGSGLVNIVITSGTGQFRVYGLGTGTRVLQGVVVKGLCFTPGTSNTSTGLVSLENFEMQCVVDDIFVDVGATYTVATGIYMLNCSHTNIGIMEVRGYAVGATAVSCTTGLKLYTDDGAQRGNLHFSNVNLVNCTTALQMSTSGGSLNNLCFSELKCVNTVQVNGTTAINLGANCEQVTFLDLHVESFTNGLSATSVENIVVGNGVASQIHNSTNSGGAAFTYTDCDGGALRCRIDTCYNGVVLAATTTRYWVYKMASGSITGAIFTDTSSGTNFYADETGIASAFSVRGKFLSTGGFSLGTRIAGGSLSANTLTLPSSFTSNNLTVDTAAAAPYDELSTISGGYDGQIVELSAVSDVRQILVKNATGNIKLGGGGNRLLGNSIDILTLQRVGSTWTEVAYQSTRGNLNCNAEEITLSTSGLTTDSSANLLPANSLIEAIGAFVTTTITTTTNWALGDGTTSNRFASANATLAAGTTSVGLNHRDPSVASAAGPQQVSAAKLRVTCTGSNPGAGKIRVFVFYRQFSAPSA